LNLASVVGDAVRAAPPSRTLVFRNGAVVAAETSAGIDWRVELTPVEQRRAITALGDAQSSIASLSPNSRGPSRRSYQST
jgi:hypothetical protein